VIIRIILFFLFKHPSKYIHSLIGMDIFHFSSVGGSTYVSVVDYTLLWMAATIQVFIYMVYKKCYIHHSIDVSMMYTTIIYSINIFSMNNIYKVYDIAIYRNIAILVGQAIFNITKIVEINNNIDEHDDRNKEYNIWVILEKSVILIIPFLANIMCLTSKYNTYMTYELYIAMFYCTSSLVLFPIIHKCMDSKHNMVYILGVFSYTMLFVSMLQYVYYIKLCNNETYCLLTYLQTSTVENLPNISSFTLSESVRMYIYMYVSLMTELYSHAGIIMLSTMNIMFIIFDIINDSDDDHVCDDDDDHVCDDDDDDHVCDDDDHVCDDDDHVCDDDDPYAPSDDNSE